jgi:hypothetical protein
VIYESPPLDGPLRQGEVIGPIWEHSVLYPPRELPWGQEVRVRSVVHDLAVVLSPDCDLDWDHQMRFVSFLSEPEGKVLDARDHPNALSRVLISDLQSYDEIRPRFKGNQDLWKRLLVNQDERYHRLTAAPITSDADSIYLNDLYLDFKRATSLGMDELYDGLYTGDIERIAMLPPYHIHDLIHRFYGFLSRVAIP